MSNKKVIYVESISKFLDTYSLIFHQLMGSEYKALLQDYKIYVNKNSFEIPIAKLEQKAEKYTCPHCLKIVEVW